MVYLEDLWFHTGLLRLKVMLDVRCFDIKLCNIHVYMSACLELSSFDGVLYRFETILNLEGRRSGFDLKFVFLTP